MGQGDPVEVRVPPQVVLGQGLGSQVAFAVVSAARRAIRTRARRQPRHRQHHRQGRRPPPSPPPALFRRANLRKRYHADGGQACTGSSSR